MSVFNVVVVAVVIFSVVVVFVVVTVVVVVITMVVDVVNFWVVAVVEVVVFVVVGVVVVVILNGCTLDLPTACVVPTIGSISSAEEDIDPVPPDWREKDKDLMMFSDGKGVVGAGGSKGAGEGTLQ